MNRIHYACIFSLFSSCTSGCALTSKAEVLDVRYFSPEVPQVAPAKASAQHDDAPGAALRLGRVSASAHLRKYIVYRPVPVEVSLYEDRWWAEAPEEYLRRALADALFVEKHVAQSLSGTAPILDVELLAFEEIRMGEERKARVSIRFALHDESRVLVAETVTVERKLDDATPEVLTVQIASALEEATDDVADRVAARLATIPVEPTADERPLEEASGAAPGPAAASSARTEEPPRSR